MRYLHISDPNTVHMCISNAVSTIKNNMIHIVYTRSGQVRTLPIHFTSKDGILLSIEQYISNNKVYGTTYNMLIPETNPYFNSSRFNNAYDFPGADAELDKVDKFIKSKIYNIFQRTMKENKKAL